ncbi:hypothetical protein [Gottfriedia acidiceleris]|uniref:Lipoprotein n=1 Tax=Gottfriedia acidiceleris TaxID=371036 RepID=A0ABY4JLU5_9BACI|nr:hypothetical protein [Gottfriedia acidiceleris]UPM54806.1 hypothetical protein MY490_02735 [Gottfriedia acidiceleris]
MRIKLFSVFLIMIALVVGCSKTTLNISTSDIEKVKVELLKEETQKQGKLYTLKLINGSDFVIKQNNVYVSFPIEINQNAHKGNDYKVEAKGNKLDIQPGEDRILNVYMPFDGLDKESLAIDDPSYQLVGYLKQVDGKHLFTIGGDLKNK